VKVPRAVIGGAQPTGMQKKLWRLSLGTYYLLVTGMESFEMRQVKEDTRVRSIRMRAPRFTNTLRNNVRTSYWSIGKPSWNTVSGNAIARGREKGVGKLAPEIVNKVKVWKFGFCQKAWPDSIFAWCKSTREGPAAHLLSAWNRGKSFETSMLVLMISRER
jgi:hypothetical protein